MAIITSNVFELPNYHLITTFGYFPLTTDFIYVPAYNNFVVIYVTKNENERLSFLRGSQTETSWKLKLRDQ